GCGRHRHCSCRDACWPVRRHRQHGHRLRGDLPGGPCVMATLDEGVAALAGAIATAVKAVAGKADTAVQPAQLTSHTLRWDGGWPARPAEWPFGVEFVSTNDPAATAPDDANLRVGDV